MLLQSKLFERVIMKKFSWRIVTSTFFRYDRDSTIVDFKNGKTQILVATRWVFVENNHVYRSPFFKMLIGNLVYVLAAWMWRNWCLLWTTIAPTTMKTMFRGTKYSRQCEPTIMIQGDFFNWPPPEFAKCWPVRNQFRKNLRVPDWPPSMIRKSLSVWGPQCDSHTYKI